MPLAPEEKNQVDRLINDRIDSVPHLEALLLFWRESPRLWGVPAISERLWVRPEIADAILHDLAREGFIEKHPDAAEYSYHSESELNELVSLLAQAYREDLVRVSRMIHRKASSPVREFAKAFRWKKDGE